MLTADVKCGLGNQMFIIATAICYAHRTKRKAIFEAIQASTSDFFKRPVYWKSWFHKIATQPTDVHNEIKWRDYRDVEYLYKPVELEDGKDTRLVGYFQSPQHFTGCEKLLSNTLKLPEADEEASLRLYKELISKFSDAKTLQTVAVHVRRQDYESLYSHHHHVLSTKYYAKALQFIQDWHKQAEKPEAEARKTSEQKLVYFIFSDDLQWCKTHLSFIPNAVFVNQGSDAQQLRIMSLCNHHIIANSTYGWWGAYLRRLQQGDGGTGIWIAPAKWQVNPESNKKVVQAIIPEGCQLIEDS